MNKLVCGDLHGAIGCSQCGYVTEYKNIEPAKCEGCDTPYPKATSYGVVISNEHGGITIDVRQREVMDE
mgnify:CR=1 FL=1